MAKDFESLKQQALVIKNEVEDGANSSERVGGMLEDILDYNKEQSVTDKANTGVSSYPVFSEGEAYTVGQVVNYGGKLYEFTADHPAGVWNSAHVKSTSLKQIQDKKLTELENKIGESINKRTCNNIYVLSPKFVPFIKELYISGFYKGKNISEQKVYIKRAGLSYNSEADRTDIFIYLMDENEDTILFLQKGVDAGGYYKVSKKFDDGGTVTMQVVAVLQNSPYDWNNSTDTLENSLLTPNAFDINVSPTINAINMQNTFVTFINERIFAVDTNDIKVSNFIHELYISSTAVDISDTIFTIRKLFKYSSNNIDIVCGITIDDGDNSYYFEFKKDEVFNGYKCLTTKTGISFEFIIDFENNPYSYGNISNTVVINRYAQNIDFSPTIKAIHNNKQIISNSYDIKNLNSANLTILNGYLKAADGSFTQGISPFYISTDFIPVKTLFDIEYNLVYRWETSACCLYDKDRIFIKSLTTPTSEEQFFSGKLSELIFSPDVFFVRFCGVNGGESLNKSWIKVIGKNSSKNSLANKKAYFIGDSIMIGNDKVVTTLSITKFITDKYGMNCVNNARGGAVLTSSDKHYAPIYKMLTSIPNDADYIIMQGGVNGVDKDATDEAPWGWGSISDSYEDEFDTVLQLPCLEAMCKYVVTNFPDKKYGFIITYKIGSWKGYWDEKSELIKQVLEKWGIPYLDWRQCGITLVSEAIREQYGVDAFASYPEYSNQETYEIDDRVIYEGKGYKANTNITEPEEWNPIHWDIISETRYDSWHCNAVAYKQLADKTAKWMETL